MGARRLDGPTLVADEALEKVGARANGATDEQAMCSESARFGGFLLESCCRVDGRLLCDGWIVGMELNCGNRSTYYLLAMRQLL